MMPGITPSIGLARLAEPRRSAKTISSNRVGCPLRFKFGDGTSALPSGPVVGGETLNLVLVISSRQKECVSPVMRTNT